MFELESFALLPVVLDGNLSSIGKHVIINVQNLDILVKTNSPAQH